MGPGVDRVGVRGCRLQDEVPLVLVEWRIPFEMGIERRALAVADDEPGRLRLTGNIAAVGCPLAAKLSARRVEAATEHDVHHPLVSGIAIFQRNFLG